MSCQFFYTGQKLALRITKKTPNKLQTLVNSCLHCLHPEDQMTRKNYYQETLATNQPGADRSTNMWEKVEMDRETLRRRPNDIPRQAIALVESKWEATSGSFQCDKEIV
ncbi:unnamed protein product [Trichobilharzia szidati]|nr:unnamed protein product [Trichobilharzia szidati]